MVREQSISKYQHKLQYHTDILSETNNRTQKNTKATPLTSSNRSGRGPDTQWRNTLMSGGIVEVRAAAGRSTTTTTTTASTNTNTDVTGATTARSGAATGGVWSGRWMGGKGGKWRREEPGRG